MVENTVALIMAGGSGTRFWPRSRTNLPKQFIELFDGRCLLEITIERMAAVVGEKNVFIVLGEHLVKLFQARFPRFPGDNLIVEPCGRDTAPAIGLAAAWIARLRPGSVMVTAPADHLIDDTDKFAQIVAGGCRLARTTGCLLTIGIPPRGPSSSYGYIEAGERIGRQGDIDAWEVRGFREKPDQPTAARYLAAGSFLWNSGIFIWQTQTILEEFARFLPEHHARLGEIGEALDGRDAAGTIRRVFPEMPAISIDYGILEHSRNILTLRGDFFWDDLGSWNAFAAYLKEDGAGNRVSGQVVLDGCRDCLVVGDGTSLVAVSGLEDVIVVRTADAVLVCRRSDDQAVKQLVGGLAGHQLLEKFI